MANPKTPPQPPVPPQRTPARKAPTQTPPPPPTTPVPQQPSNESEPEQTGEKSPDIAISADLLNQAREDLSKLTPERYLSMMDELEELRESSKGGRRDFSAVIYGDLVSTNTGAMFTLTVRADSGAQAISRLATALHYAREVNLVPFVPKQAPAQRNAPAAPATPAAPAPQGPANAPAAPATPAAPARDSRIPNPFLCTLMTVGLRPDGRTEVRMQARGSKFPDVTIYGSPEEILEKLGSTAAWEVSNFSQYAQYQTNFWVEWEFSDKLNQAGNPYKNFIRAYPQE